jgi:Berberine and berberine like
VGRQPPDLQDWARAYHGSNLDRLRRVKAAYDPGGFFRFHQSLPGLVLVSADAVRTGRLT